VTAVGVISLNAGRVQAQAHHYSDHLQGGSITVCGQPGSPIPLEPPSASATDVSPSPIPYGGEPVMDTMLTWRLVLDQLEGRTNGPDTAFRWDGEGWVGTDYNRLWLRFEGVWDQQGKIEDGSTEAFYARPIPFLRYFDWQVGVRADLDSKRGRTWGALGIEGLAPGFFNVRTTVYARDAGHFAARLHGSYDVLLTNRLIAQPEIEMDFYSKNDPARAVGNGLARLDMGLRLRYEFSRKFAPYIGGAYDGNFGDTARFTRHEGGIVDDVRFVFSIRMWY
jgi:copper resistance protein B